MGDRSIRLADIRIATLAVAVVRYGFAPAMAWALYQRRCNERIVVREARKIAVEAGKIVVEAKTGSERMQRMTYVLTVATVVITVATLVNVAVAILK